MNGKMLNKKRKSKLTTKVGIEMASPVYPSRLSAAWIYTVIC